MKAVSRLGERKTRVSEGIGGGGELHPVEYFRGNAGRTGPGEGERRPGHDGRGLFEIFDRDGQMNLYSFVEGHPACRPTSPG